MADPRENPTRTSPVDAFDSLPKYTGDADATPPLSTPDRAGRWAKTGAMAGMLLGGLAGVLAFVSTLTSGSPSLLTSLELMVGLPIGFALFFGVSGMMRGALQDAAMQSRDIEKLRDAERKQDQDRAWDGVQRILKNQKGDVV